MYVDSHGSVTVTVFPPTTVVYVVDPDFVCVVVEQTVQGLVTVAEAVAVAVAVAVAFPDDTGLITSVYTSVAIGLVTVKTLPPDNVVYVEYFVVTTDLVEQPVQGTVTVVVVKPFVPVVTMIESVSVSQGSVTVTTAVPDVVVNVVYLVEVTT